ncbi:STY4534 family ICE replication protein [Halomonas dongshanensis]|uniref:STY4534 family ICE replication protein n=1 Tax=Halomonas dongshanensis TaxID=2890835 RepID=A0ABT2EHN1_9GAMM|nr:STY4534 family ICE replication protein [Halomonas dongshanensis]MCS2611055.1 STY4534 family ICE replication protein [Halomonas dongshanensis]
MSNSTDNQFFDLHITGVGYVNRIRKVTPKRGDAFWACDISALNGPANEVEYRRFDCRVSGAEAERLVKKFAATVVDRKAKGVNEPKILIGFKLGDLYPDLFTRTKGDRAGETAVSLKARLLFINWAKVDGDKVYEAPRREETSFDDTKTQEHTSPTQNVAVPNRSSVSGSVGAAEAVV